MMWHSQMAGDGIICSPPRNLLCTAYLGDRQKPPLYGHRHRSSRHRGLGFTAPAPKRFVDRINEEILHVLATEIAGTEGLVLLVIENSELTTAPKFLYSIIMTKDQKDRKITDSI